jgi:hypothetical protein
MSISKREEGRKRRRWRMKEREKGTGREVGGRE